MTDELTRRTPGGGLSPAVPRRGQPPWQAPVPWPVLVRLAQALRHSRDTLDASQQDRSE